MLKLNKDKIQKNNLNQLQHLFEPRIDEIRKVVATLIENEKILKFREKKITEKMNELENHKIKLEDEEKSTFLKYKVYNILYI